MKRGGEVKGGSFISWSTARKYTMSNNNSQRAVIAILRFTILPILGGAKTHPSLALLQMTLPSIMLSPVLSHCMLQASSSQKTSDDCPPQLL